ncbi:MAG: multiheme c-type cytochrome [Myxococcales bacterium]|nr:multiheme c-type cytochrome [Myxococcales bacterium]
MRLLLLAVPAAVSLVSLLLALTGRAGAGPRLPAPDLTLYITAEVHGFPEPCGCTSTPLGDVARVVALVRAAGARGLLLDAGGLRYDEGVPVAGSKGRQARLKADFLERTYREAGAVLGLQPEDLLGGIGELKGADRLAANLRVPGLSLGRTVLREVSGVRIGVLGLVDPAGPWPPGSQASDPRAAAVQAVAALRTAGAQLIVALTGLERPEARRLAAAVDGLDVVVAGNRVGDGMEDPDLVERHRPDGRTNLALVVVPAREAQRVVVLDVHLAPNGQPVLRYHPDAQAQAREAARRGRQVQQLEEQLRTLRATADADPAFVRRIQQELAAACQALEAARRPQAPPAGGYVTMRLMPVGRGLERDPAVAQAMAALDRRIGDDNLRQVKAPPPPSPPGQPGYVGNTACQGSCHQHDAAHAQWQTTAHARAWRTLLEAGKQYSYDCVRCHVTGFEMPGGANLWTLAVLQGTRRSPRPLPELRNVGCEACHGPGSLHVASPARHDIPVPSPGVERCLDCHTKDHSDTFDLVPYLRDILGRGHGEEARQALGPGPTGAELRRAAQSRH